MGITVSTLPYTQQTLAQQQQSLLKALAPPGRTEPELAQHFKCTPPQLVAALAELTAHDDVTQAIRPSDGARIWRRQRAQLPPHRRS